MAGTLPLPLPLPLSLPLPLALTLTLTLTLTRQVNEYFAYLWTCMRGLGEVLHNYCVYTHIPMLAAKLQYALAASATAILLYFYCVLRLRLPITY